MGLPYVSSAGVTAISLPLNENGLLVQSVDWSASTDSTIYKSAALQGAVVGRQDRNPIMRLSVDAYMLSTTSGVPGYYPGQAVTSTDLSNWGTSAVGSWGASLRAQAAIVVHSSIHTSSHRIRLFMSTLLLR